MIAEWIEDLCRDEDEDEDVEDLDSFVLAEPDWNRPVGKCANCGDTIFRGQGGPTVHDYCEMAFIAYLNQRPEWR